jgi:electron transport complex protein RnfG
MYRALVGIGAVCGLAVVLVFQATAPVIARNRAEALERAILDVVPGAATSRAWELAEDGTFAPATGEAGHDRRVFAAYDADGAFVGLAIDCRGMGYQDTIAVLWGYSPAAQAIVGLWVLESRETPGLGDRIETDPAFRANFERLDVALDDAGQSLAHPVETVAHGKKESPWQVDGITGATISSKAIGKILDESASYWLPKLRPRLADFASPPPVPVAEGGER